MLIPNPAIGQTNQPRQEARVAIVATAYCLTGRMSNGEIVHARCIALSRPLAKDLGLKNGPGQYDYAFGSIVVIEGSGGYDGEYMFKDLMPPRWKHYRVDVWFPTLHQCKVFDVRRCQLYAKKGGR